MRHSASSGPFLVAAFLFLPVTLAGCMETATYGTGALPEMAMFHEVTGGLLDKNKRKEPIDYQPRAPLVMPAAADQLPAPAESAAAAAPDWPVDREQLKAEADARADDGDPKNDINQAEYRRLKPLADAFPEQPQEEQTFVSEDTGKDDYYKTVVYGKHQREQFAQAVADSKGYGRTERKYLTDPPLTYREPVAGADGSVTTPVEPPKKGNIFTRWWHRNPT